jgi:hypothetical protein
MTPHPALKVWLRGETNANDASRYGHHGTLQGTAVAGAVGRFGRGFELLSNGGLDWIGLPVNSATTLAGATAATYAAWIYLKETPGNVANVVAENTSSASLNRLSVGINSSMQPRIGWRVAAQDPVGTQSLLTATGTTLSLNTWYHLAGVFSTSFRGLYLDGNLVASETGTITGLGTSTASAIRVGSNSVSVAAQQFVGLIDEPMIFNSRALSIEDIRLIMTMQTPQRIAP